MPILFFFPLTRELNVSPTLTSFSGAPVHRRRASRTPYLRKFGNPSIYKLTADQGLIFDWIAESNQVITLGEKEQVQKQNFRANLPLARFLLFFRHTPCAIVSSACQNLTGKNSETTRRTIIYSQLINEFLIQEKQIVSFLDGYLLQSSLRSSLFRCFSGKRESLETRG